MLLPDTDCDDIKSDWQGMGSANCISYLAATTQCPHGSSGKDYATGPCYGTDHQLWCTSPLDRALTTESGPQPDCTPPEGIAKFRIFAEPQERNNEKHQPLRSDCQSLASPTDPNNCIFVPLCSPFCRVFAWEVHATARLAERLEIRLVKCEKYTYYQDARICYI